MREKKTSLKDIALAVGVSKATVSFVLNGKGDQFNISKEKQRIILKKAKEMAYVPNFYAKSLRQGQTKTIGLVLPDITNPYYAMLCKIIQEELHKHDYSTIIINTNDDKEREISLMKELIQRSIDAMIIAPVNAIDPMIPILLDTHIPVLFVDRIGDSDADFIGIEDYLEGSNLISKFKKQPKRLAIVQQYDKEVSTYRNRIKGISDACKKSGIEFDIINLSFDAVKNDKLISNELKKGTDAFISIHNLATFTALFQLHNLDVKVGEDVKFISFEDLDIYPLLKPGISALRAPVEKISTQVVDRMMERLKDHQAPGKHHIYTCEFIARESH